MRSNKRKRDNLGPLEMTGLSFYELLYAILNEPAII